MYEFAVNWYWAENILLVEIVVGDAMQRLRQPALQLADGCGAALAEAIRDAVAAGPAVMAAAAAAAAATGSSAAHLAGAAAAADAVGASGRQLPLRVLWAQLRLLPHACADPLEVLLFCTRQRNRITMFVWFEVPP